MEKIEMNENVSSCIGKKRKRSNKTETVDDDSSTSGKKKDRILVQESEKQADALLTLSNTYKMSEVKVHVDNVKPLRNSIRRTAMNWAKEMFLESFKSGQYGVLNNHISVCAIGKSNTKRWIETLSECQLPPNQKVDLVDGGHRITVLWLPDIPAKYKTINVELWFRQDDKPMTHIDALRVGSAKNEHAKKVRPENPIDRIHTCWAYVRELKEAGKLPDDVTAKFNGTSVVALVVKLIEKDKILNVQKKSIRKYITVAIGLMKHEKAYKELEKLQEASGRSSFVEHIGLSIIWETQDYDELVYLLNNCYFLIKQSPKAIKVFEATVLKEVWKSVMKTAAFYYKKDIHQVLELDLKLPEGKKTLRSFLWSITSNSSELNDIQKAEKLRTSGFKVEELMKDALQPKLICGHYSSENTEAQNREDSEIKGQPPIIDEQTTQLIREVIKQNPASSNCPLKIKSPMNGQKKVEREGSERKSETSIEQTGSLSHQINFEPLVVSGSEIKERTVSLTSESLIDSGIRRKGFQSNRKSDLSSLRFSKSCPSSSRVLSTRNSNVVDYCSPTCNETVSNALSVDTKHSVAPRISTRSKKEPSNSISKMEKAKEALSFLPNTKKSCSKSQKSTDLKSFSDSSRRKRESVNPDVEKENFFELSPIMEYPMTLNDLFDDVEDEEKEIGTKDCETICAGRDGKGDLMKLRQTDFESYDKPKFMSDLGMQFAVSYAISWPNEVKEKTWWASSTHVGSLLHSDSWSVDIELEKRSAVRMYSPYRSMWKSRVAIFPVFLRETNHWVLCVALNLKDASSAIKKSTISNEELVGIAKKCRVFFFDSLTSRNVSRKVLNYQKNIYKVLLFHFLSREDTLIVEPSMKRLKKCMTFIPESPAGYQSDSHSCGWHVVSTVFSLVEDTNAVLDLLSKSICSPEKRRRMIYDVQSYLNRVAHKSLIEKAREAKKDAIQHFLNPNFSYKDVPASCTNKRGYNWMDHQNKKVGENEKFDVEKQENKREIELKKKIIAMEKKIEMLQIEYDDFRKTKEKDNSKISTLKNILQNIRKSEVDKETEDLMRKLLNNK